MFEFLRKAFKSFSDKISKPEERPKVPAEKAKEKPILKGQLPEHKEPPKVELVEEHVPVPAEIPTEEEKPKELKKLEEKEERKGFFQKIAAVITEAKISEEHFGRLFTSLELELIQNNVAFPIIQQIRANLESELIGKSLPRQQLTEKIRKILRETILDTLETPKPLDILELAKEKKAKNEPLVLMFIGTNGHGKCVDGNTKLIDSKGQITKIRNAYEKFAEQHGEKRDPDGYFVDLEKANFYVQSMDKDLKIKPKKVSRIWKLKKDSDLLEFGLSAGGKVKVTPEHPFFVLDNGEIAKVRAYQLLVDSILLFLR